MSGKVVKLEIGTVYQKTKNGNYYFRYQVKGQRKAVSLKTRNRQKALNKAQALLPILKASSTEVISAHVQHAKGFVSKKKSLELQNAWEVYAEHPGRATPATVKEQVAYRNDFNELVNFVGDKKLQINEVTPEIADKFACHLRKLEISVNTHNRKLKHLARIFKVLKDYRDDDNPFSALSLRRKAHEEQTNSVRRLSFTREQEAQLLAVLEDDSKKLKNKAETRVIYYLGLFTGQRLKDCALLRWDKVNLNRKRIWVKQFKTGKEVTIPMAPQLFEVLKEAKKWKIDNYVCPNVAEQYNRFDKNGRNIGGKIINDDLLRVIRWIGLETSVTAPGRKRKVTVYGFHSLRHSFASHCAEAGVPKAVVLSILGTNSEIVDKHYTHIGEEAQEKAINSLFGNGNVISDCERIEKALSIIDALEDKSNAMLEVEKALRA
jgi:integrase